MKRIGQRVVGLTAGCALTATALTGCATGGGAAGQVSTSPRADLAAQAEVAARNAEQEPGVVKRKRGRADQGDAARPRGERRDRLERRGRRVVAPASAEERPAGASWSRVHTGADDRSDHGNGPGYADLTAVTLDDDGTSLRVTVALAGTIPGTLGSGEVQGVGVDLYRSSGRESDYQVFLDGGSDGWRGYLQTPKGFVRFPGTVQVVGSELVTVVPWSAVGGREDVRVWTFADWSDGRGRASADTLDLGSVAVG